MLGGGAWVGPLVVGDTACAACVWACSAGCPTASTGAVMLRLQWRDLRSRLSPSPPCWRSAAAVAAVAAAPVDPVLPAGARPLPAGRSIEELREEWLEMEGGVEAGDLEEPVNQPHTMLLLLTLRRPKLLRALPRLLPVLAPPAVFPLLPAVFPVLPVAAAPVPLTAPALALLGAPMPVLPVAPRAPLGLAGWSAVLAGG
mmetsp:Transcript_11098/g.23935  ORF Transcript_11098/g.23935 Transcript_11098/m.23935 type:complete len:200 (-) Transcript_11098:520-1119(-)